MNKAVSILAKTLEILIIIPLAFVWALIELALDS